MAQFTTVEVAEKFDTKPRELRKFLRADFRARGLETPGKGSRWTIEGKDIAPLKKRFAAWKVEQAEARKARAEAEVEAAQVEAEVEPTDEELAELDD